MSETTEATPTYPISMRLTAEHRDRIDRARREVHESRANFMRRAALAEADRILGAEPEKHEE